MSHFLIGTCLTIAAAQATAAEVSIVCPGELPPESMRIVSAPQGWQPFVASPLYLHSAAPIAGPPERLGRMVPRTTSHTKAGATAVYGDLDAPFPEGVWLACDYGEANQFSIAKKLPAGIKSCVVRSRKGEKTGQYDLDIKCQ